MDITDKLDTTQLLTYVTEYGIQILGAIAIFVIGRWLARGITALSKRMLLRAEVDSTLVSFGGNIIYGLLIAFVVIAALSNLGVETTSIAAIFAAAGLAVGLALQGSLSNFASGVMIIAFRPFKIGDFIEAAGSSGTVRDISIFTTTMTTGDNKTVIIPNANITSSNITNYSTEDKRRIDLVFGIGYSDDIKQAKQTLQDILSSDERVLKDPAPTIGVLELADSSVNIAVRPWVQSADYWGAYFDIMQAVKEAFDKDGISIPFPQQDVHMHQVVEAQKEAA